MRWNERRMNDMNKNNRRKKFAGRRREKDSRRIGNTGGVMETHKRRESLKAGRENEKFSCYFSRTRTLETEH